MERTSATKFIEHASTIASSYGFHPLREIDPLIFRKEVGRAPVSFSAAALVCAQHVTPRTSEPVLAWWASPLPSHAPSNLPPREAGEFCLQVVGSSESLGEILILKTLASILSEWGSSIERVRVNSFGDRDSRERFTRELSAFLRRRLSHEPTELPEEERARVFAHPFSAYTSETPVLRSLLAEAPRPIHYLSEKSRSHFKEFLEQLEHVGLPYEVDDTLGGDEREPRVIFRIDFSEGDHLVLGSGGGRYDDFVAKLCGRREGANVHASIFFRKKGADRSSFTRTQAPEPKMYFVQLGVRAKLQGLQVVDLLRRANIPVAQSFDTRSLSPQLAAARTLQVPYVIIMGQREALDSTVIVRSMRNSSQEIVAVSILPKYLKGLRV
ncbi:MAG: hypothetical protein KGJ34_02440 [Patescibacteria group bacterium]|nr:hypothetical protein [Patescibacteria group bacterium]